MPWPENRTATHILCWQNKLDGHMETSTQKQNRRQVMLWWYVCILGGSLNSSRSFRGHSGNLFLRHALSCKLAVEQTDLTLGPVRMRLADETFGVRHIKASMDGFIVKWDDMYPKSPKSMQQKVRKCKYLGVWNTVYMACVYV